MGTVPSRLPQRAAGSTRAEQSAGQPGAEAGPRLVVMTVPAVAEAAATRLREGGGAVQESSRRRLVGGWLACLPPGPIPATSAHTHSLSGLNPKIRAAKANPVNSVSKLLQEKAYTLQESVSCSL